jgi:hypothetical protein
LATITRDRSHQIIAAQSKLDKRYSDSSRVEHVGGPMVISWMDGWAERGVTGIIAERSF